MTDEDPIREFSAPSAGAKATTAPKRSVSALDSLREEISRDVAAKTVTLTVPTRPGWAVRYRCDVEAGELGRWQKAAKDSTQPDRLDSLKVAMTILANQCDALIKDGEALTDDDDDGEPVTFRSEVFLEMFGVGRAIDGVKQWYAVDGHIIAASTEVLVESGYGDEAEREEDPTQRS